MPIAPPPSSVAPSEFGPVGNGPNGPDNGVPGQATSAPIVPPDPRALQATRAVAQIVMASRQLADSFPEVIPEVREIGNQAQMIQRKLVASLPPSNPPAPPI